jgi:hypothetical protein
MPRTTTDASVAQSIADALTRRHFMGMSAGAGAAVLLALCQAAERVEAQDGSPIPVDPDDLQQLIDLSKTLCGGGNFSTDRATGLMQLIVGSSALQTGFAELTATPPVPGQPFSSDLAHATAQTILLYWYVGVFAGAPLPDRSTAYYQLTAWQAMYTYSQAVCKAYGGWADPPNLAPIVPGNQPATPTS